MSLIPRSTVGRPGGIEPKRPAPPSKALTPALRSRSDQIAARPGQSGGKASTTSTIGKGPGVRPTR